MHKCFGIDIGNSGLRLAELNLGRRELGAMLRINWCHESNSPTQPAAGERRYLPHDPAWLGALDSFFQQANLAEAVSPEAAPLWMIGSVRRDALQLLEAYLQRREQRRVQVVSYQQLPLEVRVEYPARVGIDRLLAALAAIELTSARPLVVVQAGSAVTVDLIDRSGTGQLAAFEGGAILPGVPMMLRLLGKAADMLPEIDADDLIDLPELPGRNTEQAMLCGAASALIGGVHHLIARYRAAYGAELPVIISGGDGTRLSPFLSQPFMVESHLVQRGLLRLATLLGGEGVVGK